MDILIEKIGAVSLLILTIFYILITELFLAKILIIATFIVLLIIWKLICVSLPKEEH